MAGFDPTEAVTLRNGAEVPAALVATAMITLRMLLRDHPLAFYDLATSAHDSSYQLYGDNGALLLQLAMIKQVLPNGTAQHFSGVRDIVLSACEIDGLDLRLVSPVKPAEATT